MIKNLTDMMRDYQNKLLKAYRPEWQRQEARIAALEALLQSAVCPTMAADPNHMGDPCPWCVERTRVLKAQKHKQPPVV